MCAREKSILDTNVQYHADCQQDEQNFADVAKVDAANAAQSGDPAGGKGRSGLGQDLRACDVEDGGEDGENDDDDEGDLIRAQGLEQLQQRASLYDRQQLLQSLLRCPERLPGQCFL